MRKLVVVAVVMLVASMFVSTLAAADLPPFEEYSGGVTGWGNTYQEAQWDAQTQLREIEKQHPGYYCQVTQFWQGTEPAHTPPCWWRYAYILKKSPW